MAPLMRATIQLMIEDASWESVPLVTWKMRGALGKKGQRLLFFEGDASHITQARPLKFAHRRKPRNSFSRKPLRCASKAKSKIAAPSLTSIRQCYCPIIRNSCLKREPLRCYLS